MGVEKWQSSIYPVYITMTILVLQFKLPRQSSETLRLISRYPTPCFVALLSRFKHAWGYLIPHCRWLNPRSGFPSNLLIWGIDLTKNERIGFDTIKEENCMKTILKNLVQAYMVWFGVFFIITSLMYVCFGDWRLKLLFYLKQLNYKCWIK